MYVPSEYVVGVYVPMRSGLISFVYILSVLTP